MGRRSKTQLADDGAFVKAHLRDSIESLTRVLQADTGAPFSEQITTSMVRLMGELLKPQVDTLLQGVKGQQARLQALEEQMTNLLAMVGMRNMNGPQRRPQAWNPPRQPAPAYQGPSPEELPQ